MSIRFSLIITGLLLFAAAHAVPALTAPDEGGAAPSTRQVSAIVEQGKDPLAVLEEKHQAAAQRLMDAHRAVEREFFGNGGLIPGAGPRYQAARREESKAYADLTCTDQTIARLHLRHDDTRQHGEETAAP